MRSFRPGVRRFQVRPAIRSALAEGRPVVALESAFLAHGLPRPRNLEAARAMAATVHQEGAVPAMIGVVGGRLVAGLEDDEIDALGTADGVAKVSCRDLGPVLASGGPGATTVAASLTAAASARIAVLATGGIGGVHRGAGETADVSADLRQIAGSPVAVVCSGAKAVLDLPRTVETLETLGVPVLGWGTDELPAFYSRSSGIQLAHRVDTAVAAAAIMLAHWSLQAGGLVVAVPPPPEAEWDPRELERLIDGALRAARAAGISGSRATPFLLARLAEASGGRTVETNIGLLIRNARVGARIAVALASAGWPPDR